MPIGSDDTISTNVDIVVVEKESDCSTEHWSNVSNKA